MRMIPGSHRGLVREHVDTFGEENILTRGQEIRDVDEDRSVETPLRPGQVSLHDQRVIHSSRPNRSGDRRIGFAIQSYIPPYVTQTKGRTHAQLVRGKDLFGNFESAPRPQADMAPQDVELRDTVNAVWSEILYEGAQKRRNL